ncbi:MAG: peptidase domain-containing ABC transporter [Clostridium sp.]|nr:peptidase domain-containing ABC transporter [Clostridium sp.]MCM1444565.1 peptidase domain-containing ABC transporter [Candidatus Amulumruptor caecigallinarius]
MKKYPFVKQESIKDCGACCLSMLIKYYKGNLPLTNLREFTKTNKNGTTAFHIIEAAKQIGFNATGVKTTIDKITKDNLILPSIAHIVIDNRYKHFVVIYDINFSKRNLLIADPSTGLKKISFEDFEKIWDGILIILYPVKKLPLSKDISIMKFLFEIMKSYRTLIVNTILLSLFVTLFSVISSFYLKYILDGLNYTKNYLLMLFIFFIGINILKVISDFFRNKLVIYLNQKIDLFLTLGVYNKIISLPYNYYHSRATGDIISRLNDLASVREIVTKVALSLFIDLPLAVLSIIILYIINSKLFIISIILVLLYLLIVIIFKKPINNIINIVQVNKSDTMSYMVESINGFETVKNLGNENEIQEKFEKKYVALLKNIFKFDNYSNILYFLKEIINTFGFLIIVFVGSIITFKGEITFGSLLVFTNLLSYFLSPIRTLIDLDPEIKEAKSALKRILELSLEEKKDDGFLEKPEGKIIEFKNLNYTYDDKKMILKNINIKFKREKILILGSSGSGKSTLFKLLMKYYSVPRNSIIIDGFDINDYKNKSINNMISYISQNEILYSDTVYNNLKINKNIKNEDIMDISKMCYVDEFLNELGFNMLIEENGYNISGGQKQRIFLSRALLKNFEILIIDEGLSQMDINLERKILKNIFKKYNDKMIIIISHRTDNMDLYDRVIEIKDGQVVKEISKNE